MSIEEAKYLIVRVGDWGIYRDRTNKWWLAEFGMDLENGHNWKEVNNWLLLDQKVRPIDIRAQLEAAIPSNAQLDPNLTATLLDMVATSANRQH